MNDKETMPEEIWAWDESNEPCCLWQCREWDHGTKFLRHDTAISKKALIELLEGKRGEARLTPNNEEDRAAFEVCNSLIDELIKEIE